MKKLSANSIHEMNHLVVNCSMKTKRYVPGYFVFCRYWNTIDLIIDCKDGVVTAMAITEPNFKCVSELKTRTHSTAFGNDVLLSAFPYVIVKQLADEGVDVNPIFDITEKNLNSINLK